jgi:uncharacterized RDD family membrane protein YckC
MFCPSCGAQVPPDAALCVQCGTAIAAAGTAAPPAPTSRRDIHVGPYRLAGLGERAGALLLDILFGASGYALIGMWAAARWGGTTDSGFAMEGTTALVVLGGWGIAIFLYVWLCEGLFGATLGKGIVGIQVRAVDGGRAGLVPALVRTIFRMIDGMPFYLIGFLIALFSKLRQRLGDHIAKTVVVEREWGKLVRGFALLVWMAGIMSCFWFAYKIHKAATAPAATPSPTTGITTGVPASSSAGVAAVLDTYVNGDYRLPNSAFVANNGGSRPASPSRPAVSRPARSPRSAPSARARSGAAAPPHPG